MLVLARHREGLSYAGFAVQRTPVKYVEVCGGGK